MKRGRITRPKAVVLGDASLVPPRNLVHPRPNRFTHELTKSQPYYYGDAQSAEAPDGELAAGAQVVLMVHDGGAYCRIVDDQGLYVDTAYEGLRPLK